MSNETANNLPVPSKKGLPETKPPSKPFGDEQVTLELVHLFVDCVRIGAEIYNSKEKTKADWEKVHQHIALRDKQMAQDVKQMEHEMSKITDKTDKLKFLVNSFAAMDSTKSAMLADAISKAIIQLTAEG